MRMNKEILDRFVLLTNQQGDNQLDSEEVDKFLSEIGLDPEEVTLDNPELFEQFSAYAFKHHQDVALKNFCNNDQQLFDELLPIETASFDSFDWELN